MTSWFREEPPNYQYLKQADRPFKRIRRIKPVFKRWNIDKLYNEIDKWIVSNVEIGGYGYKYFIIAERISEELQAKKDLVVQVLHKMNREGKVSQKENIPLHDSARNRMFPGSWTGWQASLYRRLK